ncbi:MAG: zinc ribbon domain-containing protein [Oscillospiraceae bacterium]
MGLRLKAHFSLLLTKERNQMKFCPYCGADLLKEDAAFCAECGKKLSVAEEAPSPAHEADSQHNAKPSKQKTPKKDSRKRKKSKQKKVQEPPLPEIEGEPAEDGYDGYYDDILPPDLDREKEGPDKELIKKIVSLTVAVIFIIGLCVVMMYVL